MDCCRVHALRAAACAIDEIEFPEGKLAMWCTSSLSKL
jgi:hypothetical protein